MKTPRHRSGRFHLQSKREVGLYAIDHTSHVIGAQARHEVFTTFGSGLSVEFVEPLEADGVNHVALHPQLFIAIR